jgi:hypothetical protein
MDELAHVKLSGDIEGDYVVLQQRDSGVLRIAPEQPGGLPKLVALKRSTWACPTQWEGTLEDGRALYSRCRHGQLSVGLGEDIKGAVTNSMSKDAFYFEYVEDAPISFDDLRAHLYGLLEFPADLVVEGDHEPKFDLERLKEALTRGTEAAAAKGGEENKRAEP